MTTEERLLKLLSAPPEVLKRVDDVLEGKQPAETAMTDFRLLDYHMAAKLLGLSRQTIRRMIHDGRLPIVEIRSGRFRVPSQALTEIVNAGMANWDGPRRGGMGKHSVTHA